MTEEISYKFLKRIGLTESEIKVYLALLSSRASTKGKLIKEAKISPSKVYEVTDRLIDKGLCSVVVKNGVKQFMAAPPLRIKDYLHKKHEEIVQEESMLNKVMPKLEEIHSRISQEARIELFVGWKGLETVYLSLLDSSKKGDKVFIIGAGTGTNEQKLELFYTKYGKIAFQKGLDVRTIFNESAREYVKNIEKNIKRKYNKKFLFNHTPTEILIFEDTTLLIIRREEPLALVIKDSETASSFMAYFKELWNIAKN